jgi:chemotaxis signal transduction protein
VNRGRIPAARLVPRDLPLLERRARELAAGEGGVASEESSAARRLVLFRIGGRPCAVDVAPVERAVSRLAGAAPVPMAAGPDRAVVFVEERPLPVADLAGTAAGSVREAASLAGGPALVLSTPDGPVAVAVEGPLDLREDRIAAAPLEDAPVGAAAGLRLAGRLADGTSVLDVAWLVDWAGRAARP